MLVAYDERISCKLSRTQRLGDVTVNCAKESITKYFLDEKYVRKRKVKEIRESMVGKTMYRSVTKQYAIVMK